MDRRGFFTSVLALVAGSRLKNLPPQLANTPPVRSGDWTIHGARYHSSTYAMVILIPEELLEGAKYNWGFPR